jgi:Co/Zn/Cd efflux system component
LGDTYAGKYAQDPRFTFGTGKLGDLAGVHRWHHPAMIAILVGYESIGRFFDPVPIHFAEAIPIACAGLAVNVASAMIAFRDKEARVLPGSRLLVHLTRQGGVVHTFLLPLMRSL